MRKLLCILLSFAFLTSCEKDIIENSNSEVKETQSENRSKLKSKSFYCNQIMNNLTELSYYFSSNMYL